MSLWISCSTTMARTAFRPHGWPIMAMETHMCEQKIAGRVRGGMFAALMLLGDYCAQAVRA